MKRLFFIVAAVILLTAAGCGGNGGLSGSTGPDLRIESRQQGPYRVQLSYPAGSVEFGSTVELVLLIEYPEGEEFILLPPAVDGSEAYSNTLILSRRDGEPVFTGKGRVESIIKFELEAWLPGEIVFPPLTVKFPEEFTTSEAVIKVVSAFDEGDGGQELSPLYLPDEYASTSIPVIITGAAAAGVVALLTVFLLLRRRKRLSEAAEPERTRAELLDDFRRCYIESDKQIDLREAFSRLLKIPGAAADDEYRSLIDEARFSRFGIDYDEGLKLLLQIYEQLTDETDSEAADEL